MDIDVDTNTLDDVINRIEGTINRFVEGKKRVNSSIKSVEQEFAGKRYAQICDVNSDNDKLMSVVCQNLSETSSYVQRLKEHVDNYLGCKYGD